MIDLNEPEMLELRLDPQPNRLSGRLASGRGIALPEDMILSLMCGETLLGIIRCDAEELDVRKVEAPGLGFDFPDYGLRAFTRITGAGDLAISVDPAEGRAVRLAVNEMPEASAVTPLGTRQQTSIGFRLVDAWLQSDRDLTLRFEASGNIQKTLDAYQSTPGGLVSVAADRPLAAAASLVTITLINPFAPLLLVFKGEDRAIDAVDFHPFPSLVRGGRHAAERLIAGFAGDEIADTATFSAELVRAWIDRAREPANCVSTIRADSQVETGSEPILDWDLLTWITDVLMIRVELSDETDAEELSPFVSELLKRQAASTSGSGHTLLLPRDCIPTISALVRALPSDAASEVVSGGMGIVDSNRHGTVWSVWQPALANTLEAFEFTKSSQFAPAIEVRGDGSASGAAKFNWPLALAFRDAPTRMVANSPFEVASDYDRPMLRDRRPTSTVSLSVLILSGSPPADPVPLLESLVRQHGINIDVLVCSSDQGEDVELVRALQRLFHNNHSIVKVPATAGRLEQIVAARDGLSETAVLIVDTTTVLPDPRTVSVLAQMLDETDVASAGCLLRRADEKMMALGAGYSFGEINLRGTPGVSFGTIDPTILRGPSTFPVVANSLGALVTRRAQLETIKASGSSASQPQVDDLLFGIQLIEAGGVNVCTTIVSAYATLAPDQIWHSQIAIPYRLPIETLASIATRSTIVQRVA